MRRREGFGELSDAPGAGSGTGRPSKQLLGAPRAATPTRRDAGFNYARRVAFTHRPNYIYTGCNSLKGAFSPESAKRRDSITAFD